MSAPAILHGRRQPKLLRCAHCAATVSVGHEATRCVCAACVAGGRLLPKTKQTHFNLTVERH
jgi:hypothetical protein